MNIIDAGYFSNHKLAESDFYSLQVKPDEFKAQLTWVEMIWDFFRLISLKETKSSALKNLNKIMHENRLVNNPIEILAALEKILPDEIRKKITYCIHSDAEWDKKKLKNKGGKKINAIDIKYNDKFITINPEQCWLTNYDEEIIKKSGLNIFEKFERYSDASNNDGINNIEWDEYLNGVSIRESFIFNTIINEYINSSSEKEKCFVRIIYNNDDKLVKPERVVLMANGDPYLAIPIESGEEGKIPYFCKAFDIKTVKIYTTSPYGKITDELMSLDKILACLDYDKIVADYKLIDDLIKIIENLKGSIQLNEIVRKIDIHANAEEMKFESLISTALDAVKDIKKNKFEREVVNNIIENIKDKIILFKNKIVCKEYINPNDGALSINCAENIIESAKKKLTPDENKAGLTDADLDISNMEKFVKYCKESLNLKPTVQNIKNIKNIANEKGIVDIQQLSELENKIAMNNAFDKRYYFASNDDKNSCISSIREVEDLLLAYQPPELINNGMQEMSKFADELWDFNPNLFIPSDSYNEYSNANKTLAEEIKASLNLSRHNPKVFEAKAMDFLNKIYAVKSEFLDYYMKIFDAERICESKDMLMVFNSILNRIEQNKSIDEGKKTTWLLQANKRLQDENNRKINIATST